MIAKLTGKVDTIFDDSIIVDVNGIGFQVFVSTKFMAVVQPENMISIRIYHVFRQEQQFLCGFSNEEELNIFKALLDVPGIGIRSAMAVLSTLTTEEFALAVANQDPATLCKVSGVGKKTAERILLELKDKAIPKIKDIYTKEKENANDAILGLISLGYQKNIVIKSVSEVLRKLGQNASTNEIIVQCLKELNN